MIKSWPLVGLLSLTSMAQAADESCLICPPDQMVAFPSIVVHVGAGFLGSISTVATCATLQQAIEEDFDEKTVCVPSFQLLYANECGCVPRTPPVMPPTLAPAAAIEEEGTPLPTVPAPTPSEEEEEEMTETPTTLPTLAPVAAIQEETLSPTTLTMNTPTCRICPEGQELSFPDLVVQVPAGTISPAPSFVTCLFLDRFLATGSLPMDCTTTDWEAMFATECGCTPTEATPTAAPVADIVEEDNTPAPTVVTLEGYCSLCPFGQEITDLSAVVQVPPHILSPQVSYITCDLLNTAATSSTNAIRTLCPVLPDLYSDACACAPARAPTRAPVAEIVEEDTTLAPTPSEIPEAFLQCDVCGRGEQVTAPDVIVELEKGVVADREIYVTCELLDDAADNNPGSIRELCPNLNGIYGESCGCALVDTEEEDDDEEEDSSSTAGLRRGMVGTALIVLLLQWLL